MHTKITLEKVRTDENNWNLPFKKTPPPILLSEISEPPLFGKI